MTSQKKPTQFELYSFLYEKNWDELEPWINYRFESEFTQYFVLFLVENIRTIDAITLIEYFGNQLELSSQTTQTHLNLLDLIVMKKRTPENILLLKILLENDFFDINDPNKPLLNTSIVHFDKTISLGHENLVYEKILLEYGANPNIRNPIMEDGKSGGCGALETACSYLVPLSLIELLLAYGADPTYSRPTSSKIVDPIHDFSSCLTYLIKNDCPDKITPNDNIPLILQELINAGAYNHDLCFPLILAAQHGRLVTLKSLEILLQAGHDINQLSNRHGSSALMYAAQKSNTSSSFETVKFLVENGADINLINPVTKSNALHYALGGLESDFTPRFMTIET